MAFVNDFLIGADPEIVLLNPPDAVNTFRPTEGVSNYWGYDHGGYVIEPHPEPSLSVRGIIRNLKVCLLDIARCKGVDHKWRAGASITTPQRHITLGGHVHVDRPNATEAQIIAYDRITGNLERLDILPRNESIYRRGHSTYGKWSQLRYEHGRHEYRTMCSWLYDSKAATLAMTGIKLAHVAPETVKIIDSLSDLQKWYELFKGKDEDVDWILDRGYFKKDLTAEPDKDVKKVWTIEETLEKLTDEKKTKVRKRFK